MQKQTRRFEFMFYNRRITNGGDMPRRPDTVATWSRLSCILFLLCISKYDSRKSSTPDFLFRSVFEAYRCVPIQRHIWIHDQSSDWELGVSRINCQCFVSFDYRILRIVLKGGIWHRLALLNKFSKADSPNFFTYSRYADRLTTNTTTNAISPSPTN
jgi:hypothetical protein